MSSQNASPTLIAWLGETLTTSGLTTRSLAGATSSKILEVNSDSHAWIVRWFTDEPWFRANPHLLRREFEILRAVASPGLPTPNAIAFSEGDPSALVMSKLPGAVSLPTEPSTSWLTQLAKQLARIHASPVRLSLDDHDFHSWNTITSGPPPPWFADHPLWAAALRQIAKPPATTTSVLLHRDYHPVNVLWQDGEISGVVDWINACHGDPGVDLAHCRVNLAMMYGIDAADGFLDSYQRARPHEHMTYWDLDAALNWMPDPTFYPPWADFGLPAVPTGELRSRLQTFIEHVLD